MGFVKDVFNGITGKTSAKAAEKAGNLQSDSSKYAADIAQKQFEQTRQDQMPWLNAGRGALGQLQGHIANDKGYNDQFGGAIGQGVAGLGGNQVGGNNFNAYQSQGSQAQAGQAQAGQAQAGQGTAFNGQSFGNIGVGQFNDSTRGNIQGNYDNGKYTGGMSAAEFEVDPSYDFRKQQGMDGLQSSAAASGGLLSGAALKALTGYNSNLASQEYGNAWQRNQAQKQQQFSVDSNLRNQDFGIFADGANRKFAADSANAQMNQQNSQFNAGQNQNNSQFNANNFQNNSQFNANQGQQNSQFNANNFQNNSQFNASNAQQNSQFNADQQQSAAGSNAQLNQNAQATNQAYGLNQLAAQMNARSQDYQMFNSEDTRRYNQYANIAGVGQQAANTLGQFGANNAAQQGDFAINGANAQANGLIGSTNAKLGGMSNLLGLGSKALGMFI